MLGDFVFLSWPAPSHVVPPTLLFGGRGLGAWGALLSGATFFLSRVGRTDDHVIRWSSTDVTKDLVGPIRDARLGDAQLQHDGMQGHSFALRTGGSRRSGWRRQWMFRGTSVIFAVYCREVAFSLVKVDLTV